MRAHWRRELPHDLTRRVLDLAVPMRPMCKVEFDFFGDDINFCGDGQPASCDHLMEGIFHPLRCSAAARYINLEQLSYAGGLETPNMLNGWEGACSWNWRT